MSDLIFGLKPIHKELIVLDTYFTDNFCIILAHLIGDFQIKNEWVYT